jgi:hypothetical protein
MIEINKNPSKSELGWFGLLALVFFALLGVAAWHKTHSLATPRIIWACALVGVAIYYAVPPLRRPVYLGWMYAAFPIGWIVSHILMVVVFYGVLTPIGLLMRAFGRDPLNRTFDRSATSYWIKHDPGSDLERYFQQY